jgi:hypothetical protein
VVENPDASVQRKVLKALSVLPKSVQPKALPNVVVKKTANPVNINTKSCVD